MRSELTRIPGEPTADLIREELEAERDWQRSLLQRALSLFASAGVIGAVSGIATRGQALPAVAHWCLGNGLSALALGAIGGLSVTFPISMPAVSTASLRAALDDKQLWGVPAEDHLIRASRARIQKIEETRGANNQKAVVLRWAAGFAGSGILLLLVAVLIALSG